jgi:hypothetical protein
VSPGVVLAKGWPGARSTGGSSTRGAEPLGGGGGGLWCVRPGLVVGGWEGHHSFAAASVPGGRGRGGVRRRSAPAGRWVYRPGCLPSLARAAGHAGRVSVVVSELGRPLNDQAAATYFFGFVSSPYGERTWKLGVTAVPPSLRARVTVRWSTRSPGVGLGWLFAIWSGTPPGAPRCASRPAAVTRRHTGRSPGTRPGSLGR